MKCPSLRSFFFLFFRFFWIPKSSFGGSSFCFGISISWFYLRCDLISKLLISPLLYFCIPYLLSRHAPSSPSALSLFFFLFFPCFLRWDLDHRKNSTPFFVPLPDSQCVVSFCPPISRCFAYPLSDHPPHLRTWFFTVVLDFLLSLWDDY